MKLPRLFRRAALLGFVGVAACDVYAIATDPFPGLVQTWNLPAMNSAISVASLLPSGVRICCQISPGVYDSSAFEVDIPSINYSRPLAANCPLCVALGGTNGPKPAFSIPPGTGSTVALPANVDSATLVGGSIRYVLTNGFTFDPIRVRAVLAQPQGRIDIFIRSRSVVIARDSVKGSDGTTWAPGTQIDRTIALPNTKISDSITVELLVDSPVGDPIAISSAGNINAVATVSNIRVADVKVRVPSASLNSGTPEELPTDQLEEKYTKRAISGGLELTITNPFAVSGSVAVNFVTPDSTITRTIPIAAVTTPQVQTVTFGLIPMQSILKGKPTTFSMGGSVASASGITVSPKQVVSIANRLVMKIRAGGE